MHKNVIMLLAVLFVALLIGMVVYTYLERSTQTTPSLSVRHDM